MTEDYIQDVATRTKLNFEACKQLLESGWAFLQSDDGVHSVWVAPSADAKRDPVYHKEPTCSGVCGNMAPHKHGLMCQRDCVQCNGVCHPDCPAHPQEL